MTVSEMRPMDMGEVLDRSFQTLRRHFGVLFATAVIGFLPLLILYLVMGTPYALATPSQPGAPAIGGALIFLLLVSMLMMAVLWGALAAQVGAHVTGDVVAVGNGFKAGFRSLLRMIGAGILVYFVMLGLGIAVALIGLAIGGVGALTGSRTLADLLLFLGFVVPGVVALVIGLSLAFLTVPALVIEQLGPMKALGRANQLAKGGRLRVCAIAILAYLLVMLPAFGLPFLLGFGSTLLNPQAAGQVSATHLYLYQAIMIVTSAVTTPFMVATMVFTYYDRRVRREGYDVELASASVATPE